MRDELKGDDSRKDYDPPRVIHSEKLQGRATSCAHGDFTCNPGPIGS